jgi:hypothetical protein
VICAFVSAIEIEYTFASKALVLHVCTINASSFSSKEERAQAVPAWSLPRDMRSVGDLSHVDEK